MSLLAFYFLRALGVQASRTKHSHFTALGETLVNKFGHVGIFFLGALEVLIPASLLVVLLIFRLDNATHPISAYVMLGVAGLWSFAGPVLIWHYEAKSIPQFEKKFKNAIKETECIDDFVGAISTNAELMKFSNIFQMMWVFACCLVFLLSSDSLVAGFGIQPFGDWLWLYLFVHVVVFSYYTSIGFALAIKTIHLSRICAKIVERQDFFWVDHEGIVDSFLFLSRRTTWPLTSGMLFIPLMSLTPVISTYSILDSTHLLSIFFLLALFFAALIPMKIVFGTISETRTFVKVSLWSEIRKLEGEKSKDSTERLLLAFHKLAYTRYVVRSPQKFWGLVNIGSIVWVPFSINIFSTYAYSALESNLFNP